MLVIPSRRIPVLDALDDVPAAAIANPGMSAWAALMERAHMKPGETMLINGATGTAGRIAVQQTKYFGAKRVHRNRTKRARTGLKSLGGDEIIPFTLGLLHPNGLRSYEAALIDALGRGIDLVIDYLCERAHEL